MKNGKSRTYKCSICGSKLCGVKYLVRFIDRGKKRQKTVNLCANCLSWGYDIDKDFTPIYDNVTHETVEFY